MNISIDKNNFSVYCSFISSCINPNAGNCSIGYSLPPRQLSWTKNVPFHPAQNIFKIFFLKARWKEMFLVQGNWRGARGRLYPILQFPALGLMQLLKLRTSTRLTEKMSRFRQSVVITVQPEVRSVYHNELLRII